MECFEVGETMRCESGGSTAAAQPLRAKQELWSSRSVWTAVAFAPLLFIQLHHSFKHLRSSAFICGLKSDSPFRQSCSRNTKFFPFVATGGWNRPNRQPKMAALRSAGFQPAGSGLFQSPVENRRETVSRCPFCICKILCRITGATGFRWNMETHLWFC